MSRYLVECGSLVTVFRGRKFLLSANSREDAAEKARNLFCEIAKKANWDVGGGIIIDSLRKLD